MQAMYFITEYKYKKLFEFQLQVQSNTDILHFAVSAEIKCKEPDFSVKNTHINLFFDCIIACSTAFH